ncbi:hypothetical protein HU200_018730 [Digitaria exilis]|uniref:AN1-type domain-containing protein n=1 Tax=Digitaria exilis TaxID=1010633 RepID=A0A835F4P2_9POAL|nr:hypothetical protein HU200_018730 [Digitaria exilis]
MHLAHPILIESSRGGNECRERGETGQKIYRQRQIVDDRDGATGNVACDGCGGAFCAAHRTYRDHRCASAKAAGHGRSVVLCPDCGVSVERTAAGQAERDVLDAHARSGRCDPAARKRKPLCPAPQCKEALTFCNATQCKGCGVRVCLKHRFPADHACVNKSASGARRAAAAGGGGHKQAGGRRPLAVSIRSFKIC